MSRIAFVGISLTLLVLTLFFSPSIATAGDLGICLPSPNLWRLPHFWSWLINTAVILLSTVVIASANKKYNFIQETHGVVPAALLILLACNNISTSVLCTSSLLLFANACSLYIIFSTYEERNATREFFFVATLPAIGAMTQYAFLVMVPVYIGGGLLMKSFHLRELGAFILGLLTPYWIAVGLGLVSPFDFRWPDSLHVVSRGEVDNDIFLTLLATGIMALIGFLLSLYNGVRLFSRNSRLRSMHMMFNLMGYVSVLAVIFDFRNFLAYFGTIALWVAVETGSLLNLYNIRRGNIALIMLLLVFIPIYIVSL